MSKLKFCLGTAQFGSKYGISNKKGKTKINEINKILAICKKNNILSIDTSTEYRNVEKILGTYKKNLSVKERKSRNVMRRYIVAKRNLDKEQVIRINDISFKRLNKKKNAIGAENIDKILGKKLKTNLTKEKPIIYSNVHEKKS